VCFKEVLENLSRNNEQVFCAIFCVSKHMKYDTPYNHVQEFHKRVRYQYTLSMLVRMFFFHALINSSQNLCCSFLIMQLPVGYLIETIGPRHTTWYCIIIASLLSYKSLRIWLCSFFT
jgi:hypothetical protein